MARNKLLNLLIFLLVSGMIMASVSCNPNGGNPLCIDGAATHTTGCDEFTRISDTVTQFRGGGEHACAGPFCQLQNNDELAVNNTGQAELHLTDCGDGRLFLFQDSSAAIQVSSCTRADFADPVVACVQNGALFVDQCAREFNPVAGSARIIKTSSSYLLTYQPEMGFVTVVVVAEGAVQVEPIVAYNPTKMGEPMTVNGGEFYFTMPDDSLRDLGGMQPRTKYPLENLLPLVRELDIQGWVVQSAQISREKQDLPPNWLRDLGGDFVPPNREVQPGAGLVVTANGGALADTNMQLAIYQAIDWNSLPVSGQPLQVVLDGEPVNPLERANFAPEKSAETIKSRFPYGLAVTLLFPAEDAEMEKTAAIIADGLAKVGVKVEVSPTPASELMPRAQTMLRAGDPIIYLMR